MTWLQKEIKEVEFQIFLETEFIKKQEALVSEHTLNIKYLPYALLLSLAGGFWIARNKSLPMVGKELASLYFKATEMYRKLHLFLPF